MKADYPQLEMQAAYGISHWAVACLYAMLFRGEIAGLEHLPTGRPFIVASNHASHLDPFAVGSPLGRQVAFFARKTLWKPGVAAWWLDAVGTIPVDRDGGADFGAIKRVIQALDAGRAVIVFPEGTRSPDGRLQTPKPGVGLIACRSQVPVVPARIFGSHEAFSRGGTPRFGTPIDLAYGPPLRPEDYDEPSAGRERYAVAAARIMAAIARLQQPTTRVL